MKAQSSLTLRLPSETDEREVLAYRQMFLDRGDSLDGTSNLAGAASYEAWLTAVKNNLRPETVTPGLVDATTFLAVRRSDGLLIGMVDVRHRLNDFLEQFGGHIGYSVLPTQRQQGYATEMLAMALDFCRHRGMTRVLVTCDSENTASEKTILANGGVLENKVPEEDGWTCRYWITL